MLILKTTRSQYGSPFDAEDDYVVLRNGQVIGRIFQPEGRPWFWTASRQCRISKRNGKAKRGFLRCWQRGRI